MKITKSTLRRIIKEELSNVLKEGWPDLGGEDEPGEWVGPGDEPTHPGRGSGTGTAPQMTAGAPGVDFNLMGGGAEFGDPGENPGEAAWANQRWDRVNTGDGREMRMLINKMKDTGDLPQDVWRNARRALYKANGVRGAQAILDDWWQSENPQSGGGGWPRDLSGISDDPGEI